MQLEALLQEIRSHLALSLTQLDVVGTQIDVGETFTAHFLLQNLFPTNRNARFANLQATVRETDFARPVGGAVQTIPIGTLDAMQGYAFSVALQATASLPFDNIVITDVDLGQPDGPGGPIDPVPPQGDLLFRAVARRAGKAVGGTGPIPQGVITLKEPIASVEITGQFDIAGYFSGLLATRTFVAQIATANGALPSTASLAGNGEQVNVEVA